MDSHHSPSAKGPLDPDSVPLDSDSAPLDSDSAPLDSDSAPLDSDSAPLDSNSAMNALAAQCNDAVSYPRNIPLSGHQEYAIDLKYKQLNEQVPRLFCSEEKAKLDFFEFNEGGKGEFCLGF